MYGGGPANSVLMLSSVKGNHRMMTQRIRGVGEFLRINISPIPSQVVSVLIGVSYWRAITCEVLSWLQSFVLRFEQVRSPSSYTENFPLTYLQDWQSDTSSMSGYLHMARGGHWEDPPRHRQQSTRCANLATSSDSPRGSSVR